MPIRWAMNFGAGTLTSPARTSSRPTSPAAQPESGYWYVRPLRGLAWRRGVWGWCFDQGRSVAQRISTRCEGWRVVIRFAPSCHWSTTPLHAPWTPGHPARAAPMGLRPNAGRVVQLGVLPLPALEPCFTWRTGPGRRGSPVVRRGAWVAAQLRLAPLGAPAALGRERGKRGLLSLVSGLSWSWRESGVEVPRHPARAVHARPSGCGRSPDGGSGRVASLIVV